MSRADSYWKCKYDELITFYPRFYRDVFEMDAILRAEGELADGISSGIDLVIANNFVDSMDEDTIYLLEKFLGITLMRSRTLEERRRMLKTYFAGQGKVSATRISEMIYAYTGAETTCEFYPFDGEGNNRLDVIFERGSEAVIYLSDIYTLLSKMLPAHIEYRAMVAYKYAVAVGRKRTHYKYSYDFCGTKPNPVLIAQVESVSVATEAVPTEALMQYQQSAENAEAGTYPQTAAIAQIVSSDTVTTPSNTNAVMAYNQSAESGANAETGLYPQTTTLAHTDAINAATEAATTSCGVDYIPCGTTYSGIGG